MAYSGRGLFLLEENMKFEKLFESKENKLYKIDGTQVPVTKEMAYPVKWSDVEGAEEEYDEAALAKLRDDLKKLEEEGRYVFIEPVYDKEAIPGQFISAMKHTSRRIKDCASVIGFAIPEQVAGDADVVSAFIEKIGEKHPHYVYFAKKACNDDIVLY